MAAALVDTNVLVYRVDARDRRKHRIATALLRDAVRDDSVRLAHQAVVEFYAAVTRGTAPLLPAAEATRHAEELMMEFEVLYPNEDLVRSALRATAAYQIGWFDALMWAYADTNGIAEILSEDFQHGRYYGGVLVTNPFL